MKKELKPVKVLILGIDGTVRYDETGTPWCSDKYNIRIYEGVAKTIQSYLDQGWRVFGASNQLGASKELGFKSIADVEEEHRITNELLERRIERIWSASRDDHWRKPRIGMFEEIVAYLAKDGYKLEPKACLMVGDMITDMEFAINAQINFMFASDFRNYPSTRHVEFQGYWGGEMRSEYMLDTCKFFKSIKAKNTNWTWAQANMYIAMRQNGFTQDDEDRFVKETMQGLRKVPWSPMNSSMLSKESPSIPIKGNSIWDKIKRIFRR